MKATIDQLPDDSRPAWRRAPGLHIERHRATMAHLAPVTLRDVPRSPDGGVIADYRGPLDDVPATVSVITTENIDRENMQDVRDLVRNEPSTRLLVTA